MELTVKGTTYIFIEESALLENGFFVKLKDILVEALKDPKNKIKILMDDNIKTSVENLAKSNMHKLSHLLDGAIDVFQAYDLYQPVETNSYLDITQVLEIMKQPKTAKKYLITQKESVYNSMKLLKDTLTINIVKFENDNFIEWKDKAQNLKAFYLDNDDYIPKVDTSNLKYVYSPKYGYLKLDLASQKSGGEGSVFKTYNNLMAKIYKSDSITYVNYKKLAQMIDMNLYNPYICWPKDLLYDNNHFVGYLMDEIKDAVPLLTLRLENFNEFSHLDRFILCYNLLKQIKYLHEKNILVGDLKPDNILVRNPEEVYFIDCGCYQIDDYACPVCHPEYTKRIFKKDEIKKQLRTVEDEYYPINKLAFEIMMRKNHTYSPDNLDIEAQDKNQFYYPLDVSKVKPQTEDMGIWCFMTQSMREYFYYYFKEGRVTDLSTWCNELKMFIEKIKKQMNQ